MIVYAGIDPVTGRRLYVRESTADAAEAERIRIRLCAQVDERRHAKTQATFRAAMEKWLRVHELDDSTRESYEMYARLHLLPVFGDEPTAAITPEMLEEFYAELRRCSRRCRNGQPAVDHRTVVEHECRVMRHKRPPGRPRKDDLHDCSVAGCVVIECAPDSCKPLSAATIRRIVEAAWAEDDDWGTLVWLVMVTGIRRAELLALRWKRVDLIRGKLSIRRNWVGGREKDTKTHQMRLISLDPATTDILGAHRERDELDVTRLGVTPSDEAFLFSSISRCGTGQPTPAASPIATSGCAQGSASTATCTRSATTPLRSC